MRFQIQARPNVMYSGQTVCNTVVQLCIAHAALPEADWLVLLSPVFTLQNSGQGAATALAVCQCVWLKLTRTDSCGGVLGCGLGSGLGCSCATPSNTNRSWHV
jgi:hypothetical protein